MYEILEKIQNLGKKKNSDKILNDFVLNLSKESVENNLVFEIVNIEKVNKSFFKMNKMNNSNSKEIHFCTICQENIKKGEHKVKLCNCDHVFHKKCLNKHLKINKTNFECPICRESYKTILHQIAENNCEL
jgi:hypothetical protein